MDIRIVLIGIGFLICSCQNSQNPLEKIMDIQIDPIAMVADSLAKYEVQIIYTEILKNELEEIHLKRHTYNLDTTIYFYPASTVKMPVAFLALQRINELRMEGVNIDINTPMQIDSTRIPQSPMTYDSCSPSLKPTVASLVEQVFAISDNNAYNRLYEFLGQDYINRKLYEMDIFTNSRIITRVGVGGYDRNENTYVNPIRFESENGNWSLPSRQSNYAISHPIKNTIKGKAYIDNEGNKVKESFDMGEKNFINLADLERSLIRALLPQMYDNKVRYNISQEDYSFLLNTMEKLPKNINCYKNNKEYYDSYVKLFLFGDSKKPMPENIIIKNKVGVAYGYLTDCAYIEDKKNNIQFFLSATIHVNNNQTYNDGIYEYDDIGIPFLAELGRQVYNYELSKKDLSD